VETDAVSDRYIRIRYKTIYDDLNEPSVTTSEISTCYNTAAFPVSASAASGGNGSFTYLWQSSTNYASWSDIPESKNSLTYQPPAMTATTYYRLKATSDYGCGSVYSDVISVTVYDALKAPAISTSDRRYVTIRCGNVQSKSASGGRIFHALLAEKPG
jgi:hypothetical protein